MCMCLLLSGHRLIFHPPLLSLQLSNSYLFSFSSLDPGFSFSYFLVSHCLTFSLDIGGSSSVRFRLKSTPAGKIRQSWCRPAARPHSCVRLTGCGARCILLHCTPLCFGDFQDGGMDLEEDNGGRGIQPGFRWVYIINVLLNRTVSAHSIWSEHNCKYCLGMVEGGRAEHAPHWVGGISLYTIISPGAGGNYILGNLMLKSPVRFYLRVIEILAKPQVN